MSQLGDRALDVALREAAAGAREIGGNNLGPFVEKYLNANHPHRISHTGQPWCVGFVLYCWLEALKSLAHVELPVKFTLSTLNLWTQLTNAGQSVRVQDGDTVSEQANALPTPKPGDIAFWDFSGNGIPDHVNMVVSYSEELGLATIGGNEGSEESGAPVAVKQRGLIAKLPKLYGFGWFEVRD